MLSLYSTLFILQFSPITIFLPLTISTSQFDNFILSPSITLMYAWLFLILLGINMLNIFLDFSPPHISILVAPISPIFDSPSVNK